MLSGRQFLLALALGVIAVPAHAATIQIVIENMVIAPAEDIFHEDDVAAGQALVRPLLQAGVSAVFCYNDMIAIGVLIPEQLSVVGFDDIAMAQYVTPPLTTIQQPKIQLGRLAMRMLLDLLGNRPVQDHIIQPTLVSRTSAARAL